LLRKHFLHHLSCEMVSGDLSCLPQEVVAVVASFPSDAQAKVLELHNRFQFDKNSIEVFDLNHGGLTVEKLGTFESMLEKDFKTKAGKKTTAKPADTATSAKRRFLLPSGVSAMLGAAGPTQVQDALPEAKRAKDETHADAQVIQTVVPKESASSSPDRAQRPLEVSLKKSVNSNIVLLASDKAEPVAVEVLGDKSVLDSGSKRRSAYAWMDEPLNERKEIQDARLQAFGAKVAAAVKARYPDANLGTIGVPAQSEVILSGRVVCEGLEGRLNERSILLEGCRDDGSTARVQLNVGNCEKITAFPGQVVGVVGRSGMSGANFHARDFIAGLPPAQQIQSKNTERPLHMLVAAGPYCLRDSLDYAPLEQLLQHAVRKQPQVLVLLGPFVDAANVKVSSGNTVLPGEQEPKTYEEIYKNHVLPLLYRGLQPLKQSAQPTEIILVPSLEEVLCFHPLPQPPMDSALGIGVAAFEPLRRLGVHFVSNPSHVQVCGMRLSLTSADALSPVLRELVLRPQGKKIEEALRMLIHQRTFFPAFPRDPGHISEARSAAFDFPDDAPPDVVIFPSQMGTPSGTFIDGTAFVNPGVLCRATLGTFAEVWTKPQEKGVAGNIEGRMRVDIQGLS